MSSKQKTTQRDSYHIGFIAIDLVGNVSEHGAHSSLQHGAPDRGQRNKGDIIRTLVSLNHASDLIISSTELLVITDTAIN